MPQPPISAVVGPPARSSDLASTPPIRREPPPPLLLTPSGLSPGSSMGVSSGKRSRASSADGAAGRDLCSLPFPDSRRTQALNRLSPCSEPCYPARLFASSSPMSSASADAGSAWSNPLASRIAKRLANVISPLSDSPEATARRQQKLRDLVHAELLREEQEQDLMEEAVFKMQEQHASELRGWVNAGRTGVSFATDISLFGTIERVALVGNASTMKLRLRLARVLRSKAFDTFIALVIIGNAVTIGIDQTLRIDGGNESGLKVLEIFEHIFMGIYVTELGMHFIVSGWRCLSDNWIRFDCGLVFVGVLNTWILEPALGKTDALEPLLVLRMARLLRLARTVRLLMKFRELWMLIRGLLSSASTMVYTMLLFCAVLYVFSCIGLEIINLSSKDPPDHIQEIIDKYFSSLPVTMLTLLQFITLDSVGQIYKPLVMYDARLVLYFISVMLILSIVLMNLVTAVIVQSALEQANQDKEAQHIFEKRRQKKLIAELTQRFQRLDADSDGVLSRSEFMEASKEDMLFICKAFKLDDPEDVFHLLDNDKTGNIDIAEFCDGILGALNSEALELKRVEKLLRVVRDQLSQVSKEQAQTQEVVTDLAREFAQQSRNFIPLASEADRLLSIGTASGPIDRELRSPVSLSQIHSQQVSNGAQELLRNGYASHRTLQPAPSRDVAAWPPWAQEIFSELRELRSVSEVLVDDVAGRVAKSPNSSLECNSFQADLSHFLRFGKDRLPSLPEDECAGKVSGDTSSSLSESTKARAALWARPSHLQQGRLSSDR